MSDAPIPSSFPLVVTSHGASGSYLALSDELVHHPMSALKKHFNGLMPAEPSWQESINSTWQAGVTASEIGTGWNISVPSWEETMRHDLVMMPGIAARGWRLLKSGSKALALHGSSVNLVDRDAATNPSHMHFWPYLDAQHPSQENVIRAHTDFDDGLVRVLLRNLTKPDYASARQPTNTSQKPDLEMRPFTTSATPVAYKRDVAILESKQQRDAILAGLDFRAALQTLTDEEQVSSYDQQRLIGMSKANLHTWRTRPLEKLRQVNLCAFGRLLFAWKFWLHVTEGDPFGRYLRHVPQDSSASLMDLLVGREPSDDEIVTLVTRLARYAANDRRASATRRRDLGGLPSDLGLPQLTLD